MVSAPDRVRLPRKSSRCRASILDGRPRRVTRRRRASSPTAVPAFSMIVTGTGATCATPAVRYSDGLVRDHRAGSYQQLLVGRRQSDFRTRRRSDRDTRAVESTSASPPVDSQSPAALVVDRRRSGTPWIRGWAVRPRRARRRSCWRCPGARSSGRGVPGRSRASSVALGQSRPSRVRTSGNHW